MQLKCGVAVLTLGHTWRVLCVIDVCCMRRLHPGPTGTRSTRRLGPIVGTRHCRVQDAEAIRAEGACPPFYPSLYLFVSSLFSSTSSLSYPPSTPSLLSCIWCTLSSRGVDVLPQIHVYQGRNLPAADDTGSLDPYLMLRVGAVESKTSKKLATTAPQWYVQPPPRSRGCALRGDILGTHRHRGACCCCCCTVPSSLRACCRYETVCMDLELPPLEYAPPLLVQLWDWDKLSSNDFVADLRVYFEDMTKLVYPEVRRFDHRLLGSAAHVPCRCSESSCAAVFYC